MGSSGTLHQVRGSGSRNYAGNREGSVTSFVHFFERWDGVFSTPSTSVDNLYGRKGGE